MQIVIELSDETYKDIKEENSIYGINNGLSARMTGKVVGAIQNGKPLPKRHGRLIDADEAIKILKSLGNRDYRREKGTIQEAVKMLSFDEYTPTIIEADAPKIRKGTPLEENDSGYNCENWIP